MPEADTRQDAPQSIRGIPAEDPEPGTHRPVLGRRVVASDRRLGPGRGAAGRERLLAMIDRLEPDAPAPGTQAFDEAPGEETHPLEEAGPEPAERSRAVRERVGASARPWRFRVSARAVRGFLLLALVAVIGAVLLMPEGGRTEALDTGTVATVPSAGAPTPGPASSGTPGETGGEIAVHVVGAVRRPGLVRLPAGSVVDDALRAAGGADQGAALDALNLAEPLRAGSQIRVPTRQEADRGETGGQLAAGSGTAAGPGGTTSTGDGAAASPGSGAGTAGTAAPSAGAGERVNLNTATSEQLQTLPRVGPKMAQKILDYRQAHGRFSSVQELDAVPGIGPTMLAALEPLVTV